MVYSSPVVHSQASSLVEKLGGGGGGGRGVPLGASWTSCILCGHHLSCRGAGGCSPRKLCDILLS